MQRTAHKCVSSIVSSQVLALLVVVSPRARLIPDSIVFHTSRPFVATYKHQQICFDMITTIFLIPVPFFKRAPYIIIHLARHAERREEAC